MWRELPLDQLAEITSGGTPSREIGGYWGGDIPWVTPTDITACKTNYLVHTVDRITKSGLLNSSAKVLPAGSILFTSRATVGVSRIAGVPVCTNQGFKSLTARPDVDGKFLFYQVQRQRGAFERYAAGSTFPEINKKDTARVLIPHPAEKKTQEKIAAILTSIDTAIETTEALIAKYQQIKAGLMHDLLTRGVLPNGQLRPPREQALELYRETAMGWIPSGWKIGQIGTYFEIQLGKMLNQLARTGRNSFLYLGNRSVQWNRLEVDDLELMDFSPEEQKKFALQYGDLLVCEGGEVGRTAIWESQIENCYYQKAIHRLRAKDGGFKPRFMLWYMHFAQTSGRFADFTSQSSIAHLTQEKLAKVPVLVPPTPEQELIVLRVDTQEALIEGQRNYLANLNAQKLGLMQDLLTGKVQVKVKDASQEALHA